MTTKKTNKKNEKSKRPYAKKSAYWKAFPPGEKKPKPEPAHKVGSEKRIKGKATKYEPVPDDIELLVVQTGFAPIKTQRLHDNPDYQKLEGILLKLKVKESIPIRRQWKDWPKRILTEHKSEMVVIVGNIPGSPGFARVYRKL